MQINNNISHWGSKTIKCCLYYGYYKHSSTFSFERRRRKKNTICVCTCKHACGGNSIRRYVHYMQRPYPNSMFFILNEFSHRTCIQRALGNPSCCGHLVQTFTFWINLILRRLNGVRQRVCMCNVHCLQTSIFQSFHMVCALFFLYFFSILYTYLC